MIGLYVKTDLNTRAEFEELLEELEGLVADGVPLEEEISTVEIEEQEMEVVITLGFYINVVKQILSQSEYVN
jgi:hypothetical protein